MKTFSLFAAVLALGFTLATADAEAAKRFGSGKSTGMQRQATTPDKAPTSAPAAAPTAAKAPAAAAAPVASTLPNRPAPIPSVSMLWCRVLRWPVLRQFRMTSMLA